MADGATLQLMAVLCTLALPGMLGCGSRDYMFGVAGQVIDVGGKPVPNARVTLTTDRPVYDSITPLRTRVIETDVVGWFAVVYRTHHLPTPYVLLVEKQGCTSQRISSVAPPSQEHSITLECQGGSQTPPDR